MKKLILTLLIILSINTIVISDELTVYPDADPESTSVDGYVMQWASTLAWADIIGYAGSSMDDDLNSSYLVGIGASATADTWSTIYRGILNFDTSALPDNAVISGAVLSIYGYSKTDGLSITPDINVYSSDAATNTNLVAGDFDSIGAIAFSTAITYGNWNVTGFNVYILNATGLLAIETGGITKLGIRNANYDVSGTEPTYSASASSLIRCYMAEETGTDKDPKLVITYTVSEDDTGFINNEINNVIENSID